jgi:hypothetical protein
MIYLKSNSHYLQHFNCSLHIFYNHYLTLGGGPGGLSVAQDLARVYRTCALVIDTYDVADGMSTKGWHLNALQDPPGIHIAVTTPMVKAVDISIEDLVSVAEAEKEKVVQRVKDGEAERGGQRVVWGCGQNSG